MFVCFFLSLSRMRSYTTVSYTHLDVYKRQAFKSVPYHPWDEFRYLGNNFVV